MAEKTWEEKRIFIAENKRKNDFEKIKKKTGFALSTIKQTIVKDPTTETQAIIYKEFITLINHRLNRIAKIKTMPLAQV